MPKKKNSLVEGIEQVFLNNKVDPNYCKPLIFDLGEFILDYHEKETKELIDSVFDKKKK